MKKVVYRLLLIGTFFIGIGFFSSILESWIIDCYQPKINNQYSLQNNGVNDLNSVKYITILSLIKQFFKNDIKYQEVLIVPSLNMEVPVAENTNDAVYQFGAGMLVKRKIDSNSNIIIGAHNLGSFSKALFSPLANNQLIDREVFITDFKLVKEYKIESVRIIFPTQVNLALNCKSNFLTMLTCTNDNKKRVLVRARLRKTYKFSQLKKSIKDGFYRKKFKFAK
ncbi:sortase [Lactobacillus johnsonii]|uniref:sortase n=1 Tax=Lactobacillus johnsonii TaxID=33959 RepID=UPI0028E1D025|nr:sortase [Lactobacillus johnsonii]MDT9605100.1 sortase [Lactobacillus johnsonii]